METVCDKRIECREIISALETPLSHRVTEWLNSEIFNLMQLAVATRLLVLEELLTFTVKPLRNLDKIRPGANLLLRKKHTTECIVHIYKTQVMTQTFRPSVWQPCLNRNIQHL